MVTWGRLLLGCIRNPCGTWERKYDRINNDCSIGPGFCCGGLYSDCAERYAIRGQHDATNDLLIVLRGRTLTRWSIRYSRAVQCLVAVYTGGRDAPFPNSYWIY